MNKKIAGVALLCAWLFAGTAYAADSAVASGSNTVVLVNNHAQEIYPYNIDGNNYFKLRDLAAVLANTSSSFAVQWDSNRNAISLDTAKSYTVLENDLQFPHGMQTVEAVASDALLYCDGKRLATQAYNINGSNYFKLRDIGKATGFDVVWDEDLQLMRIETGGVENKLSLSAAELDTSFFLTAVPEDKPEAGQEWENTGAVITPDNYGVEESDVKKLLNGAVLHPQKTQFGIINSIVDQFMRENFTSGMDTYTRAKVAYDYFINNMTYATATQLDTSMFTKAEAAVIWQCYPERYVVPIMLDHKGVCNHYSCAYAAILRGIGLDAAVVSGKTKSSAGGYSSHVWVTVNINGVDYLFDPQVDQRIAQRNGNKIQYNRFGKSVRAMGANYTDGTTYYFAEHL